MIIDFANIAADYDEEIGNFYYGSGHPMKVCRFARFAHKSPAHPTLAWCCCLQPHRIRMAHNLILNYGLYKRMEIFVRARLSSLLSHALLFLLRSQFIWTTRNRAKMRPQQRPQQLSESEMTKFHADDYVHFLQHVSPDNMNEYSRELNRCTLRCCASCLLCIAVCAGFCLLSCSRLLLIVCQR